MKKLLLVSCLVVWSGVLVAGESSNPLTQPLGSPKALPSGATDLFREAPPEKIPAEALRPKTDPRNEKLREPQNKREQTKDQSTQTR